MTTQLPSRNTTVILVILFLLSSIQKNLIAETPYTPPTPTLAVSSEKILWHDEKRNRDVPVKIYFPKEPKDTYPLIIFSHGLGASRDHYEYLAQHWVGCGYISLHLQHLGSDDSIWKNVAPEERVKAVQLAAMNINNALNRPTDAQFAIDQLFILNNNKNSPLHQHLDLTSIAVAGHSFGGFTSLAIAGQTFIFPFGKTHRYHEPRVKAALQMSAPAPLIRDEMAKSFSTITIPTFHMTGTKDFLEILPQTTAADRRIPYDLMTKSETCLVIFNEGDHMIFSGRENLGTPQKLAQDAKFQKLISIGSTAFWDAYLKNNAAAKKWLLDGGYKKLLNDQATFEHKSPALSSKQPN